MNPLNSKLQLESHVFFGICDDNLFVQIATRENVIAFEAEAPISVNPSRMDLMNALFKLFPDSLKQSGIRVSKINYFEWDGKKISASGEETILECQPVNKFFPKFVFYLFANIWENEQF